MANRPHERNEIPSPPSFLPTTASAERFGRQAAQLLTEKSEVTDYQLQQMPLMRFLLLLLGVRLST